MTPAVREVAAVLRAAGVEGAGFEARLLVGHVLGVARGGVLVGEPDREVLAGLVARRVAREPMALIVGRQGFWTLDLEVSRATLIPRADSEAVIEAAVAAVERGAVRSVLDLGTGTGCLLLAALVEFPGAFGVGVDVVPAAAALAARNAAASGLAGRFDVVLSNPPYIPTGDLAGLMAEVVGYEPGSALDGGADGLVAYRRLMTALPGLLAPGGVGVLELGVGQMEAVSGLAEGAGLEVVTVRDDLGGVARALVVRALWERGCGAEKTFGVGRRGG